MRSRRSRRKKKIIENRTIRERNEHENKESKRHTKARPGDDEVLGNVSATNRCRRLVVNRQLLLTDNSLKEDPMPQDDTHTEFLKQQSIITTTILLDSALGKSGKRGEQSTRGTNQRT